jgi:hypothetical protein
MLSSTIPTERSFSHGMFVGGWLAAEHFARVACINCHGNEPRTIIDIFLIFGIKTPLLLVQNIVGVL